MADGRIEYQVRADTSHVNEDMEGVSSTLESSGSKWTSIVDGAMQKIGMNFTDMAVKAAKAAWDLGTGFEDGMAKVSTLMDTSVTDMSKVSSGILQLSSQFGISANEMSAAAYNAVSSYTKFATDSDGLMQVLSQSAQLAKAGFTDIDTAASATLKTMNAYGLGLQSVDMIQKVLIQTQNNGITTVDELGRCLSNVTPTAAAMGVSFEQVGAALATMTAQGTPAAQATTQLNSLLAELGKSGTTASNALAEATKGTEYAGMSFQQMQAAGVPLNEILDMMRNYAEANGKSLLDMFGSIEAGKAALAMTGENAQTFTNNLQAMGTQADVVGQSFGKVAGTASEQLNQTLTQLSNVLIQVFQALSPLIGALLQVVGVVANIISSAITPLMSALQPIIDIIAKIGEIVGQVISVQLTAAFTGIGAVLNTFGSIVSAVLGPVIEWLGNVGKATTEFANVVNAGFNELGQKISAWANDVKGWLSGVGEWLSTTFKGMWEATCSALGPALQTAKGAITTAWEGIKGGFQQAGDWLSSTFKPIWEGVCTHMSGAWDSLKTDIGNRWEDIKGAFSSAGSWISSTFGPAWKGYTEGLAQAFDGFKNGLSTAWEGIKGFFSNALSWLGSAFSSPFKSIWEGLSSHFGGVFEGLKSKFTGPINWIIDKLNSFIDGINAVKIPDWVPAVGGMGFSIPHLPRLKVGMDYVPSDNFPALLHKGEAVLTAAQATEWRGGQGRGASGADAEAIAAALAVQLKNLVIPIYLDGREVGRGVEPYVSSSMADRYNSQQRSGYRGADR